MTTNVVDIAAWAGPCARLVALCKRAVELFASGRQRTSTEFDPISTDLTVVLNEMRDLPALPGEFGRALTILRNSSDHEDREVLAALQTLSRLSAITPQAPTVSSIKASSRNASSTNTSKSRSKKRHHRIATAQIDNEPQLPGFEN